MAKNILNIEKGRSEFIGFFPIVRSLPNANTRMIGHFIFLDQMPLKTYPREEFREGVIKMGDTSHPHRGIATLTYLIRGSIEHFDSAGHRGTVGEGGMQWMKAGNGIVHNEVIVIDDEKENVGLNGLQFWINLPAKHKAENPDYRAVQGEEIQEVVLENNAGILRVLLGEYKNTIATIPTYSKIFLYHIKLNAKQTFSLTMEEGDEVALVPINGAIVVNEKGINAKEMLTFETSQGEISMYNNTDDIIDVMLFGGEKYMEPVVMGGPFVMNSEAEMSIANQDYMAGKYGTIE